MCALVSQTTERDDSPLRGTRSSPTGAKLDRPLTNMLARQRQPYRCRQHARPGNNWSIIPPGAYAHRASGHRCIINILDSVEQKSSNPQLTCPWTTTLNACQINHKANTTHIIHPLGIKARLRQTKTIACHCQMTPARIVDR